MKGCMNCDYCHNNDTMNGLCLCVNGNSEMFGEFVSNLDEEMECCVNILTDDDTDDEKNSFTDLFSYLTDEEKVVVKNVILERCNYKESLGIQSLYDSDITDIMEECERKGIKVRRRDIEALGD